jgi:tRNA pseudouridine55 synthase
LARRGKPVELAPRTITIHSLNVVSYAYPELQLDIRCGSGTYVRSLGRDIARVLGTEAVMSALERMEIGEFHVARAYTLDQLTPENVEQHLVAPLQALAGYPRVTLTADEIRRVFHGMTIACSDESLQGEIAAVDEQGTLVALLTPREPGWLRPVRTFAQGGESNLPG